MAFFAAQGGDDADDGGIVGQVQFALQAGIGPAWMKPLDVDAVGDDSHFVRRAAFVVGQVTTVRFGHGDEGVGDGS